MELSQNLLGEQMQKETTTKRCENYGILKQNDMNWDESLTEEQVIERVEKILQDDMQAGNQHAIFQLGQYYFEQVLNTATTYQLDHCNFGKFCFSLSNINLILINVTLIRYLNSNCN